LRATLAFFSGRASFGSCFMKVLVVFVTVSNHSRLSLLPM
jgi:hypothetical protein